MLIGCCHCDGTKDPPSESLPPSSSGSSASSIWVPEPNPFDCSASHCIGSVSANAYNLDFDIGSSAQCGASYQGAFSVVAFDTFVGGYCAWKSAEFAKKNNAGSGCSDYLSFPRFMFTMVQSSTSPATGARYALVVRAARQVGVSPQEFVLVYAGNLGNSAPGSAPTARINCLGAITLPLWGSSGFTPINPSSGSKFWTNVFYFAVTNTNPHGGSTVPWSFEQTLYPSSVTLTPA